MTVNWPGVVRLVVILALIVNGIVNAVATLDPATWVSMVSFLGFVVGGVWLALIIQGSRDGRVE